LRERPVSEQDTTLVYAAGAIIDKTFPLRNVMGKQLYDPNRRFVSEFQYDLRDPDDRFTHDDFLRVREAVLDWSLKSQVPVEVRKSKTGFEVAITHYLENGDAFGMSLFLHLSAGIFRQIEQEDDQRARPQDAHRAA
jgi:hypothetical protein